MIHRRRCANLVPIHCSLWWCGRRWMILVADGSRIGSQGSPRCFHNTPSSALSPPSRGLAEVRSYTQHASRIVNQPNPPRHSSTLPPFPFFRLSCSRFHFRSVPSPSEPVDALVKVAAAAAAKPFFIVKPLAVVGFAVPLLEVDFVFSAAAMLRLIRDCVIRHRWHRVCLLLYRQIYKFGIGACASASAFFAIRGGILVRMPPMEIVV